MEKLMRKQLLSYEEGTPVTTQHKKPCSDCPWARTALPGWLGSLTPQQWLQDVHGEANIACHTLIGAQCAGAAIYRGNVGKLPRDPDLLRLPADQSLVFATPVEFCQHHDRRDGASDPVQQQSEPTLRSVPHFLLGELIMAKTPQEQIEALKAKSAKALEKAEAKGAKDLAKILATVKKVNDILQLVVGILGNPALSDVIKLRRIEGAVNKGTKALAKHIGE